MRDMTGHSAAKRDVLRGNRGRFALFGALALLGACSAPGTDALGTSREAASTPFANDKTAYDYFIAKGLTDFQAAGVVGNLDQESGVNPNISQAGGGVGRGIAQWSAGARWDTTKDDNVIAYAAAHGQSAMSLTLQLDFIWYELTTFPNYGLAPLKASTNLTDATTAFEDKFEGCVYANYPECALPMRVTYANNVLKAYGSGPGSGGAGSGGSSGSGGSVAGASGVSIGGSSGSNAAGASAGGGAGAGGTGGAGAGANSTGGSSTAGNAGAAGSASVPGGARVSSADNSPSCAFSRASTRSSAGDGWLGFSGALLVLGLALRASRRLAVSGRAARVGCARSSS